MNNIQTDTSEQALVTAIRANMTDAFRFFSRSMPEEHYEDGKFTRWFTGVQHPWFNGVLASQPPADGDENFIRDSIQYFRNRGVDTFTWWLEPPLSSTIWEPVLKKNGFGFSDGTPGMAVDLKELNVFATPVGGLEIKEVTDESALRTWCKIFVMGYGLPPQWEPEIFNVWLRFGFDLPIRNYVGFLDGKPVSTSTLILGGGAAGIYDVATLPEVRGRGIGAALTVQPLLDAGEMGYQIGTLQSSEMGFGVYQKLGFRHLCQIENFYASTK